MFGIKQTPKRVLYMFVIMITFMMSPSGFAQKPAGEIELVSFVDPPYLFEGAVPGLGKGLAYDIVDQLFKDANITYSLRIMPPKRAILHASNTASTCVFPIERNQEREVKFSWISPVIISRTGLFSLLSRPVGQRITTLIDAKPFRIGSHLGSATGEYLKGLGYQVDDASQNTANIHKLKANRIDLWESDYLTAQYTAHKNGIGILPSRLDFFTSLRAIGCHPSVPERTVSKIRQKLYDMYRSGKIDQIKANFNRKFGLL